MASEVLNIGEVAELMRVSRDTIYRLVAKGDLPGRKVGRAWRFSREAIAHYLNAPTITPYVKALHESPVKTERTGDHSLPASIRQGETNPTHTDPRGENGKDL